LRSRNIPFIEINLDEQPELAALVEAEAGSVPVVRIKGKWFTDWRDLK